MGCSVEEENKETENIKNPGLKCDVEGYHSSGLNSVARRLAKGGNLRLYGIETFI